MVDLYILFKFFLLQLIFLYIYKNLVVFGTLSEGKDKNCVHFIFLSDQFRQFQIFFFAYSMSIESATCCSLFSADI